MTWTDPTAEPGRTPGDLMIAVVSAGLLAGGVVGVVEAVVAVGSTRPSEYSGLFFALVGYGAAGALFAAVLAPVLVGLGLWAALPAHRVWALTWHLVVGVGGTAVAVAVAPQWLEREDARAFVATTCAAGFSVISVPGAWAWSVVLTRTPLRVLPAWKGTAGACAGLLVLSGLFSLSPAPGVASTLRAERDVVPGRNPSLVLFVVDAVSPGMLGAYGAARPTPRIDAVARDGVVFDRTIAAASAIAPAYASILTAQPVRRHGCDGRNVELDEGLPTLAEALRDIGYRTGGLPNHLGVAGGLGFDRGFDWYPFPAARFGVPESAARLTAWVAVRAAWARWGDGPPLGSDVHSADRQAAAALQFIRANADVPHLLVVHLGDLRAARADPEADTASQALRRVDAAVGTVVDELLRTGRYADTILAFVGTRAAAGDAERVRDGVTLLDAEVRVPLIVKLPDGEHAGLHVPWQVRTIDLAPTLVDVAGYGPPEAWAGRSLFDDEFDEELSTRLRPPPPWRDDEPDDPAEPPPSPPTIPPWDTHPASRPAVLEQWAAGYHLAGLRAHGRAIVRALRMPAANPLGLSARELYDLTVDPDERRDLAGTGLEWEESMVRALDAQLDAAGGQVLVAPDSTPRVY